MQNFHKLSPQTKAQINEKVQRELRNHVNGVNRLSWARFVYLSILSRVGGIDFYLPIRKDCKVGDGRGVYLVEAEGMGRYKIGWSESPRTRLRDLQVGSPVKLKLLSVIKAEKPDEFLMHSLFASANCHGEWFSLPKNTVRFLQSLKQSTC